MPEQEPTINPEAEKQALYERQKELVEQIKLARQEKDTTKLRALFEELERISLPRPELAEKLGLQEQFERQKAILTKTGI